MLHMTLAWFRCRAGEFGQINATPHQPGEQAREAYDFAPAERQAQLGARRVMAHDAQRPRLLPVG
jgi:hypothetical protein